MPRQPATKLNANGPVQGCLPRANGRRSVPPLYGHGRGALHSPGSPEPLGPDSPCTAPARLYNRRNLPNRGESKPPGPEHGRRARPCKAVHAETYRHPLDPDHRGGAHRHRPGLRVRLLRRPGLQGAARGGLPGDPGELQPRHHHDRPRDGRRHLHRADHPRDRRQDHRRRAPRRALAHHGRPDRAQHRAQAGRHGRAGKIRRRADRRQARGHREGRGPQALPRGDGAHRAGEPPRHHRPHAGGGAGRHRPRRPAGDHPPRLHPRRHRRRRRLQPRGLCAHLQDRAGRLAGQPDPDRRKPAGLEGIRDGGGPRQGGQLHHRLLHREHRPDGRAHGRHRSPSPRRRR